MKPVPPTTVIISVVFVAINEYQTSSSANVPATEQAGTDGDVVAATVWLPVVNTPVTTGKDMAAAQLSFTGGIGVALTHTEN